MHFNKIQATLTSSKDIQISLTLSVSPSTMAFNF
jgi:hypothetical protein